MFFGETKSQDRSLEPTKNKEASRTAEVKVGQSPPEGLDLDWSEAWWQPYKPRASPEYMSAAIPVR